MLLVAEVIMREFPEVQFSISYYDTERLSLTEI